MLIKSGVCIKRGGVFIKSGAVCVLIKSGVIIKSFNYEWRVY